MGEQMKNTTSLREEIELLDSVRKKLLEEGLVVPASDIKEVISKIQGLTAMFEFEEFYKNDKLD